MHVHKAGYTEQNLPNVAVTAGAVTTVNFQLVALFPMFFEGDLAMGIVSSFEMLNLDTDAHPNLNFIFENLSTTVHRYYAAAAPADLPGAGAVLDVAPGLAIPKTIQQLITELGFNETKHYLNVFNIGPAPAHFKVTIEE